MMKPLVAILAGTVLSGLPVLSQQPAAASQPASKQPAAASQPASKPAVPLVTHGPWLTHAEPTAITIGYVTQPGHGGGVDVRARGTQTWRRFWHLSAGQVDRSRTQHPIRVTGLQPDTDYEYRLVIANATGKIVYDSKSKGQPLAPQVTLVEQPGFTFRTYPAHEAEFTFSVTSDLQFGAAEKAGFLQDYQRNCGLDKSRFLLIVGDANNEIRSMEGDVLGTILDPLARLGGLSRPTYLVRGNHEWRGKDTTRWLDFFAAPRTASTYFSFTCGNTLFIVLDSGEDKPAKPLTAHYTGNNVDDASFMREQHEWLKATVASQAFRDAKYRIIVCHSAIYSHGGGYMRQSLNIVCGDLFTKDKPQNRIHLWLAGHTHVYARTIPGDNQRIYRYPYRGYKVDSGRDFDFTVLTADGPGGSGKDDINNCLVNVTVTTERLSVSAKKRDGTTIDAFDVLSDGTCVDHNNDTLEVKRQPANYR